MSIRYTPVHVCNFCGDTHPGLIIGISGLLGGESPAEICPTCVQVAAKLADFDGPRKHPTSSSYEQAEREEKQRAYLAHQSQQTVNVFGQVLGDQANLANSIVGSHSLNDPGQCHGNDDPYSGR